MIVFPPFLRGVGGINKCLKSQLKTFQTTSEERELIESRLQGHSIQKTPGICGGHARIRNTRIPVWTLVSFRQQGADNTELLRNFPSLNLQDLNNAWDYYEHHRSEIDSASALQNNEDE